MRASPGRAVTAPRLIARMSRRVGIAVLVRPISSRSKVNSTLNPYGTVLLVTEEPPGAQVACWSLQPTLRRPCCLRGGGSAHPVFQFRSGMERRGGASGACATRSLWHPLRSGCRVSGEDTRVLAKDAAPPRRSTAAWRLRKAPRGKRINVKLCQARFFRLCYCPSLAINARAIFKSAQGRQTHVNLVKRRTAGG